MIKHMFQKFFSQYREGGFAVIKFTFQDSDDTWVRLDTTGGGRDGNHPDISVADAGTGLVTLTYPKCRHVTVVNASIDARASTAASQRHVSWEAGTTTEAKAGTLDMFIYKDDETSGVPGLLDPVDGSILTVTLYIGK